MSNPDGILFNADDSVLATSRAPGMASLALTFPSTPAGPYHLEVVGLAFGTQGGIYNGALSDAVVPTPEPETSALMLGGLGVVGFMAARRRRQS